MKKVFSIVFILTLISLKVAAQSVDEIVIDDEFYDNKPLNQVFADLQRKYNFKMEYDDNVLKRQKLTFWFNKVKLSKALKECMKQFKDLRYAIDDESVIHIFPTSGFTTNANAKMPMIPGLTKETVRVTGSTPRASANVIPKFNTFTTSFNHHFKGAATRQNFTLSGKVIDVANAENLPFVTVRVKGSKSKVTQTNVDGYFTLQKVPTDTSTLEISYIGYKGLNYFLSPKTPINDLTIEMEVATEQLEEVVVSGQKTEVMKANEVVGMIKMTPRNIAKLPNIGERDPFRAFQLMPGVSASNESSSGLYVRGGTPDQTLVLYDGFTVYHVDHLYGFYSAFNYNAIKDIQLFKGGYDAKFGGRISGVAEITGKEGNKKEFNAGADVSLLSNNAYVESPIGDKFTVLVAARRSWRGPLYDKIFNTFKDQQTQGNVFNSSRFAYLQATTTPTSYFYDLNGKVTYRPNKNDILTLSLYNGADYLDNSNSNSFQGFGGGGGGFGGGSATTDVSNWGNTGASVKWSRRWTDKFYSNFLVSYSNYYSNRDNTRTTTIQRDTVTRTVKFGTLENNDLKDFTLKADFEYKIGSHQELDFGTHLSRTTIKYDYSQNDTISILSKNDKGWINALYAQDRITFANGKGMLLPGARLVYFDVTNKLYFEPRISGNYQITKQLKLKGAAGIYNQFAKQINREDVSQGNRDFWLLSNNTTLPVTNSVHYILGGSYETKDYLFDVEFYQKNNTGITEYTLRFVPTIGRGLAANETFFTGTETIRGVDFLFQKKFGNYTGWLGYTLSEAVRNIAAFSDKPYYSDQDVRHQFKMVHSYKYKNWDFALTWIYSTGRPYTSIIGAYNVTLLDGTTNTYTNPSDKNANRFPDYHRMDVSATYNFSEHFNVGFSIFNLYNRYNTWYKKYDVTVDSGQTILTVTDVKYLGFTPNLTLSWKLK